MDVFLTGIIVLLGVTAIFYIVIFSFIYYWHLKKVTFVVVPMLFAFEFLIKGFLLVSIAAIILKYVPELIRVFGA